MIYTSGTSSRPKGVVHAHRVVLGRAPMHRDWEALGADDVMLHAGAFNWSYTLGRRPARSVVGRRDGGALQRPAGYRGLAAG